MRHTRRQAADSNDVPYDYIQFPWFLGYATDLAPPQVNNRLFMAFDPQNRNLFGPNTKTVALCTVTLVELYPASFRAKL